MKSTQKGFTLIELMIVVAIIAILAAIAIPQYQTYVIRSQVTRAMGEAGDLKTAVEDCLNNGITVFGSGSCVNTSSSSDILSPDKPTVAWSSTTPSITATLGNHANTKVSGSTIVWLRNSSGSWSCSASVASQYAPASCQ
ncbi:pilin [Dyella acidiphila]|uniref:Pilin n=1 Tax=Dyella acidiphila TaxID=2775866 RepID=A0ABR9G8R9_9GAMM|nr:pilin [Dyella acidiphila]MBE1160438.1 pilin [Dyella acidiphila]